LDPLLYLIQKVRWWDKALMKEVNSVWFYV
jgi:hypothetical protein